MVPEMDELIGKMSFSSRLPQYLITAILTGAVHVTVTEFSGKDILIIIAGGGGSGKGGVR